MSKGKGYSFNADFAKSKTKSQFVKHFEKIYPHLDLSAIYEEVVDANKKKG